VATSGRRRHVALTVVLVILVASGLALVQYGGAGQSPMRTARTWLWKARFWAFPVQADVRKLASYHTNAGRGSRDQCVACHQNKTGSKLVLHRIHLTSPLLVNLECHDCHRHINLNRRGNKAVVTWVDVGFCKKCHSAFPGLQPGSPMKPEYFKQDCTKCHTGDKAPKHDQPYLPKTISSSECAGCHGGRVLPSTVRHEQPDWIKTHGAEALAVGADSCYRCHDFGLKFCDRCHSKKPPTHLPAEKWRTIHSQAAKTDTRVCYSCHKVSFCKRCHLNHEQGWMQRHASFVKEQGDSSCTECHSKSACGYCHMHSSGSVESSAGQ
jgi:hypothetical protein